MVISLTVILIECTGNVQYGLPIMVTLIASYMVGNIFNEGLYDIHIHINHYPLLEWDPPHWYNLLTAADVMMGYSLMSFERNVGEALPPHAARYWQRLRERPAFQAAHKANLIESA